MASNSGNSTILEAEGEELENEKRENKEKLKATYLKLRAYVGALAISLPFIVWIFDLILRQSGIQPSISAYYHTEMRNWFVGSLFAIGFFLLAYNPGLVDDTYKNEPDQKYSVFAGILAIIVALTPTGRTGWNATPPLDPPLPTVVYNEELLNNLHVISAGLFFGLLAYFSLVLFRKSVKDRDPKTEPSFEKMQRNKVYLWCGIIMSVCVFLMVLYSALPYLLPKTADALEGYNLIFYLEFAAILAFGISWFVKGEALSALNDKT